MTQMFHKDENRFVQGVLYGGVNRSGVGGGVLSIETRMDYYRSTSVVRPLGEGCL